MGTALRSGLDTETDPPDVPKDTREGDTMIGRLWAWHGTRLDHDDLDLAQAMARNGYDQHGSGLYLTSSLADALSYSLPLGHLWRCMLDEDRFACGATVIQLSRHITHYLVTDQSIILRATRHRVVQNPVRKLNHRERMLAASDPDTWNLCIEPLFNAQAAPTGRRAHHLPHP